MITEAYVLSHLYQRWERDIILTVINFFLFILKWLFYLSSPFIFSIFLWTIYFRLIKKVKPIKNECRRYKTGFIFKRLFWDFPRQLVNDILTIDPNTFKEYGMHLLCGEQGSGKTTLMAYLIRKYKYIYPRVKVRSNFDCTLQDYELKSWKDLTLNTNGIYGEDYVYHQCGNALDTLLCIKGVDTVLQDLKNNKPERSEKYRKLINDNGGGIIDYLRERNAL